MCVYFNFIAMLFFKYCFFFPLRLKDARYEKVISESEDATDFIGD